MFEVEKPRKFHYQPRFYDPEKEKWEALKQKYAEKRVRQEMLAEAMASTEEKAEATTGNCTEDPAAVDTSNSDAELAYFQQRVRQMEQEKREKESHLGIKDLFRKREMPKFHYESRFDENGNLKETTAEAAATDGESAHKYSLHKIKIRRRFDISDEEYLKPVSGTKIILYCFLVCLLLYWILF